MDLYQIALEHPVHETTAWIVYRVEKRGHNFRRQRKLSNFVANVNVLRRTCD